MKAKLCKCGKTFYYEDEDAFWDYEGFTNVKLITCPDCGLINVIKYEEDNNLDINNDPRYYTY